MNDRNASYFLRLVEGLRRDGYQPDAVASSLPALEKWLSDQAPKDSPEERAEKQLHSVLDVDRIFKHIVDDALIGIAVFEDKKILYANAKLMQTFGYKQNPKDAEYDDFVCPRASYKTLSTMEEREKLMKQGFDSAEPFIGEFTGEDGAKMFLEIHSRAFRVPHDVWRICFMLDVTDKINTQDELDKRILRFQNVIAGTDATTWEWNLDENTGTYNEKWSDLLGYTREEIKALGAKMWNEIIHPDDAAMVEEITKRLVAGEIDILTFEARLRHKDGHYIWILSRGRVSAWREDGRPLTLSGANIEITDKKLAEAKLVLAKEELEKSIHALSVVSQAKEDFLSTMSHEIRTPLNAVIGLTNLLLRRNPRQDQLEIVKTLKNAGDNLLHLVNDILDYNKIEAGKLQLESITFKFKEFLEHLYSIFKLDAFDKNIDLRVTADPDIPDIVRGDVTRLNQIFTNLLGNALKFTKKGRVSLDASLVSLQDGICRIRFVVTDTGIGIHPSKLERIFEPFHQSDASINRKFGGSGLGLSIIRGLVKVFQGTIEVNSLPGQGSSFTVTLDLQEQSSARDDTRMNNPELPFRSTPLSVLYVEDVASNRFLVANLMEEFKFKCTIVSNGYQALEKTLTEKFDVILMDIQMPGMDGYTTAEYIFKQQNGMNALTPIIAFTAEQITESLKAKLNEHHISDVINKPFDIDQFVEKLSTFAEGAREYSLDFYHKVATRAGDTQIYKLVCDEVEEFTQSLEEAYDSRNLTLLRQEIHKLRPIIKNLGMTPVIELFDRLNEFQNFDPSMLNIIYEIRSRLEPAVRGLRSETNVKSEI